MKGEPRAGQAASKPANNQPKPVQRPATAAPSAAKVRKRENSETFIHIRVHASTTRLGYDVDDVLSM